MFGLFYFILEQYASNILKLRKTKTKNKNKKQKQKQKQKNVFQRNSIKELYVDS